MEDKPLDPNVIPISGSRKPTNRPKKYKTKKPAGRPREPINADRIRILASYGLNVEQIAAAEQVHPNTIYTNFGDAYRQGKQWGRGLLVQSLAANAIRHNNVQAQIFLAKNWLGYSEKGEVTINHRHTLAADRIDQMSHEERTAQIELVLRRFPFLAGQVNPPNTIEGDAENPQSSSEDVVERNAVAEPPLVATATEESEQSS